MGPQSASVRRFAAVGIGLLGMLLAACTSSSNPTPEAAVRVTYEDIAPSGYIDQTVTLEYSGSGLVTPIVEYVALDAAGDPVEGVTVTAAFGSDQGELAISSPGGFDVLAFHGDRVTEVVDIDATVVSAKVLGGGAAAGPADPIPLFDGDAVTKFDLFDAVEIENATDRAVAARVVCLVYDFPTPGEAQQAEEITVLVDRVEIPGDSTAIANVDDGFLLAAAERGFGCDSLKAHLTPWLSVDCAGGCAISVEPCPARADTEEVKRKRSPQEKKILSYARDRRNVYGENDKASRKNIPRSKAMGARAYRSEVKQAMREAGDEADIAAAEVSRRRFAKDPDVALGAYLDGAGHHQPEPPSHPSSLRREALRRLRGR